MNKKLIDIFPPNETRIPDPSLEVVEQEYSESEQKMRLGIVRMLAAVLVLILLPAGILHFFFARADILIWPQMGALHVEESITAQVGVGQLDLSQKIVRAKLFEKQQRMTQTFKSSGMKTKQEKAHGVIRVYNNNSTAPQILIATTRFISEDGKLFRSQERVRVPGGVYEGRKLIPGFLDIEVTAAENGAEYNIDASNFSLPGLAGSPLYTKIYGVSTQAMIGGTEKQIAVVTENDIQRANERLFADLEAHVVKSLLATIPVEFDIIENSFRTKILEDNTLVKEGAELEEFTYTAKIQTTVVGFARSDVEVMARKIIDDHLGQNSAINESTLQITAATDGFVQSMDKIPMQLTIDVDQYEKVDIVDLQNNLYGVSEVDFQHVLAAYPYLAKVQFSLWPFWSHTLPNASGRVQIELSFE